MFCPMCGAPNEDDALYCEECGAALAPEDEAAGDMEGTAGAPGDPVQTAGPGGPQAEPDAPESRQVAQAEDQPGERTASSAQGKPVRRSSRSAGIPGAPTSGLAIASFILGIGGLTVLPLLGSVAAVLLGYLARSDIRRRPGEVSGDGLAVAGLVMGWLAIGAAILIYVLALLGITAGLCCLGPCGVLSISAN